MFEILKKISLNPTVTRMDIYAPRIAQKAEPGQFVILRVHDKGERVPLTIADFDREAGTVSIIFQIVGGSTQLLDQLKEGESLCDLVGPLGKPTDTNGLKRVAVVGGGVGCAIAYPIAKKLHAMGCAVHTVAGFRTSDLVILEDEFKAVSEKFHLMTDDGSAGEKGLVTDALRRLIEGGEQYDRVITIGPTVMMKFVCQLTKELGVPTVASMSPVMIDGTGMCGGCRLTVGGKTVFACVDGPEFDGHLIDFDEALMRGNMYSCQEQEHREATCNLFREVK